MTSAYAREAVPEAAANRSAISVTTMVSSAAMGVPVMLLGASIGHDYGAKWSLIVIAFGCAITAALAAALAHAGVKSRKSTALLSEQAFGSTGAHFLNLAVALALLGWFSVEMGFVGSMVAAGVHDVFNRAIGPQAGIAVASIIICSICMVGIGLVLRAPMVFLPLLATLLLIVGVLTLGAMSVVPTPVTPARSLGTGVSSVVGAYIVGCLIMPDYSRFIRTSRAAVGAMTVALGPVYALVLATYAFAGLATNASQPNIIYAGLGLPAVVGLLLPIGLMQNGIMCLYSSAMATSTVWRRPPVKLIILLSGFIGLCAAIGGASSGFVRFLVVLGVIFPPAVALLLFAGLTGSPSEKRASDDFRWGELSVWCLGIVFGAASEWLHFGATGFSAFDGFLASAVGAYVLWQVRDRMELRPNPGHLYDPRSPR